MALPDWSATRASPTVVVLADEYAAIHRQNPQRCSAFWKARDETRQQELNAQGKAADDEPIDRGAESETVLKQAQKALCGDFHAGQPRSALCLSGGGIRSAAFGLGVLQWLATRGYLGQFQYLSTVSGGGYIGAWLSSWIAKEKGGWKTVQEKLSWDEDQQSEPKELRHLREYSRFLTPQGGPLSGDTWAAVAITLRNLLLNWLLVIPLIASGILAFQLIAATVALRGVDVIWVVVASVLAAASYWIAVFKMACGRPRWSQGQMSRDDFTRWCLLPLTIAALAWLFFVASVDTTVDWPQLASIYSIAMIFIYIPIWIYCVGYYNPGGGKPYLWVELAKTQDALHRCFLIKRNRSSKKVVSVEAFTEDRQAVETIHYEQFSKRYTFEGDRKEIQVKIPVRSGPSGQPPGELRLLLRDATEATIGRPPRPWERRLEYVSVIGRAVVVGLCLATLHYGASRMLAGHWSSSHRALGLLCLLLPGALAAHVLGGMLFVGLMSQVAKSEEDREWHGRADGLVLMHALLWALVFFVTLILPEAFAYAVNEEHAHKAVAAIGGIAAASGSVVAFIGRSALTPATTGVRVRSWIARLVLPFASIVFLVSMIAGLSLALDLALFDALLLDTFNGAGKALMPLPKPCLIVLAIIVFASMAIGFGRFINVNRFSLHSVYRNRLIKAFLGGTKDNYRDGETDPFTGFNDSDNIELQRLWDRRDVPDTGPFEGAVSGDDWRPFHVMNMALNVASGDDLALADRKALPFVATPLWCGAANLNGNKGAFRLSSEYGGKEKTISVGTAMAISGAAVSPNMGYHSSPMIRTILTLLNVRLGWWFGNPADDKTFFKEGPTSAIQSLFYEATGRMDEKTSYVYLSDGGHFENLGLYEMVRRRCHLIMVVDAGQDADCTFNDLAMAAGKIQTDFHIPITFDLSSLRKRNLDRQAPRNGGEGFALGTIDYQSADGDDARQGIIIYVKPAFRGDEPVSILGYASESCDFPHESTMDQWFSETQFESYRALGFETMARVAKNADLKLTSSRRLATFFQALHGNVRAA